MAQTHVKLQSVKIQFFGIFLSNGNYVDETTHSSRNDNFSKVRDLYNISGTFKSAFSYVCQILKNEVTKKTF